MENKATYAEAICMALDEEMERDEKIIIIGEDVGLIGGLFLNCKNLFNKYGADRIMDTPISENSFVGCAIGASMTGPRSIFLPYSRIKSGNAINSL